MQVKSLFYMYIKFKKPRIYKNFKENYFKDVKHLNDL